MSPLLRACLFDKCCWHCPWVSSNLLEGWTLRILRVNSTGLRSVWRVAAAWLMASEGSTCSERGMGSVCLATLSWHMWSLHNMGRESVVLGKPHQWGRTGFAGYNTDQSRFCPGRFLFHQRLRQRLQEDICPSSLSLSPLWSGGCAQLLFLTSLEAASFREGGMTSEPKEAGACHSSPWLQPSNLSKTRCSNRCGGPSLLRPVLQEENLLPS